MKEVLMEPDVLKFVRDREVVVLGTVGRSGVQVAAVHYALDDSNALLFKSRSDSDHILALQQGPAAAGAIYEHSSTFATKAGVQLKGEVLRIVDPVEMEAAVEFYSNAFAGAREKFDPLSVLISDDAPSTLYRFVPREYKFINGWLGDRFDRKYQTW